MLKIKEQGTLICIIEHCKRIEEKMLGVSRDVFEEDKDIFEIVCFNILQIGELAKGLSPDFIKAHGKVPWDNIKGMRDRVAHGYGTINVNIVWDTATNDIKPLHDYCQEIIDNNN